MTSYPELKTLRQKRQIVHDVNVFKTHLLQRGQQASICGKGLTSEPSLPTGGYVQHAYPGNPLDVQNASHDRNRDTEMLNLDSVMCNEPLRRKHFDWCILSVLGYICCAPIGLCAMYYSMRANHGHDHNIEEYKIQKSSTNAKVLTILSVIMGSLCVIVMGIVIVYMTTNGENTYMNIGRNNNNQFNQYDRNGR